MSGNVNNEMMSEVQEQAILELKAYGGELIAALLGTDGAAYGDQPLTRGERIARFIDDAEMGALDALRVISPTVYVRYVREYVDDIAHSGLVSPPVAQPYVDDVIQGVM